MPNRRRSSSGQGGIPPEAGTAPKVFFSYRNSDTADVAYELSELLREDLGSSNVFRDKHDLIAGTKWKDALAGAIADSDTAAILIGPQWTGLRDDGTRRIDDPDDPVANEVRLALDDANTCQPLPVLVDHQSPPHDLPPDLQPLFDHHAVTATRDSLLNPLTKDYQSVLVGVWESIRQRTPRGVLVIGDHTAMASLDAVIADMKDARLIDARRLSRFASGAYVVSARRWRKGARKWPDAIVVVGEGEPSETLRSRIQAINDNPSIRSASIVGAGVVAGFALSQVLGVSAGNAATAFTASSQVAPVIPQIGTGPFGAISTAWVNATRAARVGLAAGTIAVAGVSTVAVTQFNSAAAVAATYGYLNVEITSARSSTEAPEGIAVDDPAVYMVVDITLENPLRDVSFSLPAAMFSLGTGGEVAQAETLDGEDIQLEPQREIDAQLWFAFPAGTPVNDPVLTMREKGAEPLVMSLTEPNNTPERVPVAMSGDYETECRMIVFGPGFGSYNAGTTAKGDGRPGPHITDLGRAAEDELLISFDITASERCAGATNWFNIRTSALTYFSAILESTVDGQPVPTANSEFGNINGETIDGYVTAAVPEDAIEPLDILFFDPPDERISLLADLTGIGVLVVSD